MKLLILLLCLGMERYLHIGGALKRFHWFEDYLGFLQRFFSKSQLMKGWGGIITALLPIVIIIEAINHVTFRLGYGLSGLGLHFLVLLYCLGPDDLYHQIQSYFSATDTGNKEQAAGQYQSITGVSMDKDEKVSARKLSEAILVQSNERFFGVIFWYMLLGPSGAVIYRAVSIMRQYVEQGKEWTAHSAKEVLLLQNLLDWIPARLTAFVYVIVGGFQALGKWLNKAWLTLDSSQTCLRECGIAALTQDKNLQPLDENKRAVAMLDRALAVVLAATAIFTLGALVQ